MKGLVSIFAVHVCLVISAGAGDPGAVMAAIRGSEPHTTFVSVWAGDPTLRPVALAGAPWIDTDVAEHSGVGWNRLLAAMPLDTYALARGTAALAEYLNTSAVGVAMVRVGRVAVSGRLPQLIPASGVCVIERMGTVPPADGLAPGVHDLIEAGRFATAVIGFAAGTASIARAISEALVAGIDVDEPGGVVAAVLDLARCPVHRIEHAVAVGWRVEALTEAPALLDVTQLDPKEPWHVTFAGRTPRTLLSSDDVLRECLRETSDQWEGDQHFVRLPGAIAIDEAMRNLVSRSIHEWRRGDGPLLPEPFGRSGSEMLRWLETPWPPWGADIGRYWTEVRELDHHLIASFPRPEGADHAAFVSWAQYNRKSVV